VQDPKKINPPVTTEPQPIELGSGLDFTRPKLKADPGSLLDCENFEVVDNGGYGRIAGLEPFDGRDTFGSVADLSGSTFYRVTGTSGNEITELVSGAAVANDNDPLVQIGVVLSVESEEEEGGVWTYTFILWLFDGFSVNLTTDYSVMGSGGDVVDTTDLDSLEYTGLTRDAINGYASSLREDVTAIHSTAVGAEGKTGAIGLHWFRDRLYAVANELTVFFDSGGTTELRLNQYVKSGTATGRVLYISLNSGTWGAGTAAGWMQIESYETGAFSNNSVIATYTDDTFATPITADIATVALVSDITGNTDPLYAGMFVALSDDQATELSLNPGWNRIDCGWSVGYDAGYSESGSLTKIEKGTAPSYTPGTGSSGTTTANLMQQAVSVEDEPAQVQGWKSSAAETVYTDDASILSSDNNTFLYGDFFTQQWGLASGGAVYTTQPSGGVGASDSAPLQEFDPAGQTLAFTVPGAYSTTIFGSNGYTYFTLNGIDSLATTIPENARIVGITVTCKYDAEVLYKGWPHSDADIWLGFSRVALEACLMEYDEDSNSATKLGSAKQANMDFTFGNFTETHDETVGSTRKVRWTKNAESTLTYGSTSDLWGLSTLTRARMVDPGFTVGFRGRVDCGSTSVPGNGNDNILIYRPQLDYITFAVQYVTDSVRYYFKNGTDCIRGDLVYYNTVEGTFQGGDAEGNMQLVNVVKNAGAKYMIEDNMTIHTTETLPATSADQVGVVNGNMVYNGLPGLDSILTANSRYEFITANFYGTDGLDGMYGVSGAGKAFSLNTFLNSEADLQEYIVKITTNPLDEEGDAPRHVAFHHYALALGFSSGIVRLSVLGEPEEFSGLLGAAEVGVGDKVTGLLPMRGMTLGVFCENSIWGITGTDSENYTTQTLAPNTGAIEYTVADTPMGPMFCHPGGISTFEQSAAYGNFAGSRVSKAVTPWILPRMIRYADLESTDTDRGLAGAYICRAKNQYRPFFRDGKVLSYTLDPDMPPAPTFSTYYIGQTATSETDKYLVPLAWSSQMDQRGKERIHVSHYSATSDITAANSLYVYELERGWGFAGKFIPAHFATNWYHPDPWKAKQVMNVRMDGLSLGYGSSEISVAKDYEEVYNTVSEPISLPASPDDTISEDYKATTHMGHIARTGRSFSFKVEEVIPSGDTIDDPTPPCIYQLMLLQFASGGKTDS
jgi:hypothetical protein